MVVTPYNEQCDRLRIPSHKQLVQEHIVTMVVKTMEPYVLPSIAQCVIATTTFDLSMSKIGFNTFVSR
jgi:hypothetical protein